MEKDITWVGMDAHKKFINIAVLDGRLDSFIEWKINYNEHSVKKLARKLVKLADGGEVRCCYEAGPCGYALARKMEDAAPLIVEVIAPSLIPYKPGERIKTDKRDARKLAEMNRANLLTVVHPPTKKEESVKDLCRCREAIKSDLMTARHRLSKFLLRRGYIWGQKNWSHAHKAWLRKLHMEDDVCQAVLDEYLLEIEHIEERLESVTEKLETISQTEPYREAVGWLQCFHGIKTIAAMTILAELHDFRRFTSPRGLMNYLGLTPSENSSGASQKKGGITKAGNSHVRKMLIEIAHHYRHRPRASKVLRKRRQGQPASVITIANKAHQRLHRKYAKMYYHRGKPRNTVVAAVARELTGFVWAVLYEQAHLAK
jgi:transposase